MSLILSDWDRLKPSLIFASFTSVSQCLLLHLFPNLLFVFATGFEAVFDSGIYFFLFWDERSFPGRNMSLYFSDPGLWHISYYYIYLSSFVIFSHPHVLFLRVRSSLTSLRIRVAPFYLVLMNLLVSLLLIKPSSSIPHFTSTRLWTTATRMQSLICLFLHADNLSVSTWSQNPFPLLTFQRRVIQPM